MKSPHAIHTVYVRLVDVCRSEYHQISLTLSHFSVDQTWFFFSRIILSQCSPLCSEFKSLSFTKFWLKMRENGPKRCEWVRLPVGCGSGCAPPCDRIRPNFSSRFIIELIHMVFTWSQTIYIQQSPSWRSWNHDTLLQPFIQQMTRATNAYTCKCALLN
jgi:hypothetical protein